MMTIYRYTLLDQPDQTITGPIERIVAVDNRRGELEVWAEVNTDNPDVNWDVYIVGTGGPIEHFDECMRVGLVYEGPYVLHVYARRQ